MVCVAGAVFGAPVVTDFGPLDTHRAARQVRLRFSEDMVALGDNRAADPARVSCSNPDLHAKGHWIDARNWVGEFAASLPDGVRCRVEPVSSMRSLAGAAATMPPAWEFTTGGPQAEIMPLRSPSGWDLVRERPLAMFSPTVPVDPASLRHLSCKVDGKSTRVRILEGAERDSAIELQTQEGRRPFKTAQWIAAQCGDKPWPNGARIVWTWGKKIASPAGVSSQSDSHDTLRVRDRLGVFYQCKRLEGSTGCDPRQPVHFQFSELVARDKLSAMSIRGSSGKQYGLQQEGCYEAQKSCNRYRLRGMPEEGETLRPVFTAAFADVDGRKLAAAQAPTIAVARLPAYLGMPQGSGALGWKPGATALWPLAARGTEPAIAVRASLADSSPRSTPALLALHRLARSGHLDIDPATMLAKPFAFSGAMFKHLASPPAQVRAMAVKPSGLAMEFVGIPLSGYGSWLVEADSPRFRKLLKLAPSMNTVADWGRQRGDGFFRSDASNDNGRVALVQLTNLSIHVRASGAGDSLVWVTAVDTGKPVAGVDVELWSCTDRRIVQARTDADGRATISAMAPRACTDWRDLWVVARHGEDIAVLPFQHDGGHAARLLSHTIVDRVLLHPGETVSMQHIVRLPTAQGWSSPRQFKGKLRLYYNYSDKVHEQDLEFDERGSAVSSWPVPAGARLGHYRMVVHDQGGNEIGRSQFQVEEFRRPSFDARLSASAAWQGARQSLTLAARLHFMAGGAAAGQAVVIKGRYEGYAAAPLPEYTFSDAELPPYAAPGFAQQQAVLDKDGQASLTVPASAPDRPSTLRAEMQFTDPNGEVQTTQASVALWPQREKLGLRVGPAESPDVASISAVLLDEKNAPLAGREIVVDAVATRDHGGSRAADEERAVVCTARTDAQGKASCSVPWTRSTQQPYWLFRARTAGAAPVSLAIYKDTFAWSRPKEALSLASKAPARAGEPVLLRLRSPLVPSTVLLTVEREGVLASHVLPITAAEQEFAMPTGRAFAPGVRVQARFVDGKKTASASLELGFDHATHQLKVDVGTARDTARPGQTVPATIKVLHADGRAAAGARVTVAAFDDALESLRPNSSWWVASTFWRMRWIPMGSHDLTPGWTGRLLGPQRDYLSIFEERASSTIGNGVGDDPGTRKVIVSGQRASTQSALSVKAAAAPAFAPPAPPAPAADMREVRAEDVGAAPGTGAALAARTDFSSLALWKTDVVLDGNGQAQVAIPLKDSLTRWRIVAVAMDGSDQYGYGHQLIQTTKPIQVLSGLPQVVRSGDRLVQAVTVRNDSAAAVTLQVKAESAQASGQSWKRKITLAPRSNQVLEFDLAVPDAVPQLDWRIEARQADGDGDAVHVTQRVLEPVPVTVRDSTIVQVDGSTSVSVARPAGALPGKGGVGIEWKASLVDAALLGARTWMRDYPYACLEQISSKAAVSGNPLLWRHAMDRLSATLDIDGTARYFPGLRGSEVLTAYLLDLAQAYQLDIPEPAKAKMQAALRQMLAENRHRDWVPDHGRLAHRLALQAAIAPNVGSAKPVIPEDLSRLPTIALMDWVRYLLATPASSTRSARLDAAADALRGRYDLQSTRLSWRADQGLHAWWMMWTADVASARMALLAQQWQAVDPRWKDDAPRLMLALVDKQRKGHWDTTTSNAWAVAALQAFARSAEGGPVAGSSRASLGAATNEQHWPAPGPTLLPWSGADKVDLRHSGSDAPWATVTIRAAMRLQAPVAHGVEVSKTINPVEQRVPGKWSQGDVLKVTLALRSHGDNSWLVINDPIPSGASILGKGLGGESALAMDVARALGDWWTFPSVEERGNDSYRAYYQRIGARAWSLSYLVRLNNPGSFQFPATRVEAMYAPEIFAEVPNAPLEVGK